MKVGEKPKSRRARRIIEKRAPKVHENPKIAIFLRGRNCSQKVYDLMKDLSAVKKPHSALYGRKHDMLPFDDDVPLELLAKKTDSSLFCVGTHTKKRPNTMVFGRHFDHHVLDMVELGVTEGKQMKDFKVEKNLLGSKPAMIFAGDLFETDLTLKNIKSIFADFFRGEIVDRVNLEGIDHVLSFTATPKDIVFRHYRVELKQSGEKTPIVELVEIGPRINFKVLRTRWASDDLMKTALKQPRESKPRKVKNIERSDIGDKTGRIHMHHQDYSKLQLRKTKALKRKKEEKQVDLTKGGRKKSK